MNISEEQEIKKEFQLERVILFSDAVFAIIITIMVIDIKLPEGLAGASTKVIQHDFFMLLIKLIAYAFSFFLVAMFWVRHLRLFSFLKDYNVPLVAHNLLFLFCVSLFPFAISMISGASGLKIFNNGWGVNIYITIILSVTFSQTLLTRYVIRHKDMLCIRNSEMDSILKWKVQRHNIYIIPALAVVVFFLNYFNLPPAYSMYAVALLGIINGRLGKLYYPKSVINTPFGMLIDQIKKPRKKTLNN